ncbi:MAG: TlyA family RNA methyltransferase [Clostridia bacterium]|nr:TlyA family RNA methyltransferase [Clostridia bacterium]
MRIDVALVELGLCESRNKAARLIEGGKVTVNGLLVKKPSENYEQGEIKIEYDKFVSRGGYKLEEALERFGIDVKDVVALDIGASTGGFTDCLLQRGAKRVVCVDVGEDQLHHSLKNDPRVSSYEKMNARYLDETTFGEKFDVIVTDVSFISQGMIYNSVSKLLKDDGVFVSLIKPQFEVGKKNIGKNGIVKNEKAVLDAIEALKNESEKNGLIIEKTIDSPILGGDGNKEYLALIRKR